MKGYRGAGEEEKARKPLGTGRSGVKGEHLKDKYCCAGPAGSREGRTLPDAPKSNCRDQHCAMKRVQRTYRGNNVLSLTIFFFPLGRL